ncbi:peptidoglycan DD-metalloendopeptidase family protein [Lapillicoccus jejuensis]|uniref:Peptidase M23-like protein n=1 Tax=Lapillicoccus jejuensis TaxID=402171 RepID=A0A542E3I5_9MICO|nr:peptidoglycan DD-metalloendopeptidase family protein [Lapillicoccus jejuensis]TQJ09846.1 peptidase M23-like protein [Lapillicoccus jejuensis]
MLLEPALLKVAAAVAGAALAAVGSAPPAPPGPSSSTVVDRSGTGALRSPSVAWRWPLAGTPPVVHAFVPPPGPYAPGHRGVDLGAAVGAVVLAPAAGTVTVAGRVAGVPVVVVAHAGGLRSTLQPVAATVPVGATVRAGDPVAVLSGDAGHCAPAGCLHWGVLRGTTYLDPSALLRPPRVVLLPWS